MLIFVHISWVAETFSNVMNKTIQNERAINVKKQTNFKERKRALHVGKVDYVQKFNYELWDVKSLLKKF